ncbi:MAG: aldose 1-epimerase [Victivallales bacterium]|nr:aldose 1-epimerase [Victivallales bacterium]
MQTEIFKDNWGGLECINLLCGGYRACILPEKGANIIRLLHEPSGIDILRTPQHAAALAEHPEAYGIPILFFPNRIADGSFCFDSVRYDFPVNKVEENNHIHGFLHKRAWRTVALETSADAVTAVLEFHNTPESDFYSVFPFDFTFQVSYSLSVRGLEQKITVNNRSPRKMPFGLGFHSALNVPFGTNRNSSDFRLKVPLKELWLRDERNLPSGEIVPLENTHKAIADGSCNPVITPISGFYSAAANADNIAVISDISSGISVIYEADRAYRFWVLWNDGGNSGFVCPEPQTMMVNAFNIAMPEESTGVISIESGGMWSAVCRLAVRLS